MFDFYKSDSKEILRKDKWHIKVFYLLFDFFFLYFPAILINLSYMNPAAEIFLTFSVLLALFVLFAFVPFSDWVVWISGFIICCFNVESPLSIIYFVLFGLRLLMLGISLKTKKDNIYEIAKAYFYLFITFPVYLVISWILTIKEKKKDRKEIKVETSHKEEKSKNDPSKILKSNLSSIFDTIYSNFSKFKIGSNDYALFDYMIFVYFYLYLKVCKKKNRDLADLFLTEFQNLLIDNFCNSIIDYNVSDLLWDRLETYDHIMQTSENKDDDLIFQICQYLQRDRSNEPMKKSVIISNIIGEISFRSKVARCCDSIIEESSKELDSILDINI